MIIIGQTQTENYIKTTTYKVETTLYPSPTNEQKEVNVTYFDGLGRPIQQIANAQSATGKNIVTPIEYDGFDKQVKEYLPYATQTNGLEYVSSALTDVLTFYNTPYYGETTNPYTQKEFEFSPLERVLKQAWQGNDWALGNGKEIKYDYQTNVANEVKLFKAVSVWSDSEGIYTTAFSHSGTTYYPINQLYKTITKDENWSISSNSSTEEFKDAQGKVILKRAYGVSVVNGVETNTIHDTYYVYDQYGNLTYVLPPLSDGNTSAAVLNELCYQYKYDYRNRLAEKKSPGKQTEYIVYDKLDRVVATGPVFNPFGGVETGWLITKYDAFSRPVYTGWKLQAGINNLLRKSFQANYAVANQINEYKSNNGSIENVITGYSNQVEPTNDLKLLTINYYDNYDYPNALTSILNTTVYDQAVTSNVKGLETGSWVRILENPTSVVGELTHTFYDVKKYRSILTRTTNYLGGFTEVRTKYNFEGDVLLTLTSHKRTNDSNLLTTLEEFEYTPQGRLLNHFHTVNGLSKELLSHKEYDELGKLIIKNVGGDDVVTFTGLQKVDYKYNIRGWLIAINDVKYLTIGSDPEDLFGFRVNYNYANQSVTGVKPLYDGSIAETFWSSSSDNTVRKYGYIYDDLNRLKDAIYQKDERPIIVTNSYDEHLRYDKNGNITYLSRNGNLDEQNIYIEIDNLDYEYYLNSNRIKEIRDNTNDPMGFKDSQVTGTDYNYDDNGNMISDANKGITNITYNHLNLPSQITFGTNGSISYLYDATGGKIKKYVIDNLIGSQDKTDYLGGFQYKNEILQFFPTAEGYVNAFYCVECQTEWQYKFNYVYNYTDHIGNIRLSYSLDPDTNALKIIEENHYYPFGLKHTNYNGTSKTFKKEQEEFKIANTPPFFTPYYSYKYNGKEFQEELGLNWYDYGWRNYDPTIDRWVNVDPLLNDLNFAFDESKVDDDDEGEVFNALITKLETGGGVYNTNNLNPYGYGYNNPVLFDDPDGRCPWCLIPVIVMMLASEPVMAPTTDRAGDAKKMADAKAAKVEWMMMAVPGGGARTATAGTVLRATVKSGVKQEAKKYVEKTYQTYTKTNKKTGEVYSGRTSGKGTPNENVAKRDASHHKNKEGFGKAKLDKSSANKDAIKGREQQLIDKNGKAKSEKGTSGNAIRAVSKQNPNAKKYKKAAKNEFGS